MILYFDCFSGISGDMTLGAFMDLGVPFEWLKKELSKLNISGFEIKISDIYRMGIKAKNFNISIDKNIKHNNYLKIKEIIKSSYLSSATQKLSLDIFEKIALAEAKIHGIDKDKVHFHELGSIDAIVDVIGTALCIEYLNVNEIFSSKIPLGHGFVNCEHGTIPVPAPATLEILNNIPVYDANVAFELVTPTGAAIISTIANSFGYMPEMSINKTGYGAGKRDIKNHPNLLRIIKGEKNVLDFNDKVVVLETCIDDMNPEIFSFLMECLFNLGALDVYWIPVYMKKNRPGTKIEVICKEEDKDILINKIFSETTTTGIRYNKINRKKLYRNFIKIDTIYGTINAKKITGINNNTQIVPEYEDCKKIAVKKNIPIKKVYNNILKSIV